MLCRVAYIFSVIFFFSILSSGCSALNNAGNDFGKVSDELGAKHELQEGDDTVTINMQADDKLKIEF